MHVTSLRCGLCGLQHDPHQLQNLCSKGGKPLLVEYDLGAARCTMSRESLASRVKGLWRYREVVPVRRDENIIAFGEGFTPLLPADRLGRSLRLTNLFIKDESQN